MRDYGELVNLLRICPDYCKGCMNCPHEHDLGCRTTMMGEAADAIEELTAGRLVALDDRTALAIAAGARAIRENKRLVGTKYVFDVFGKMGGPYEIGCHEASKILASIWNAYPLPEALGGDA